MAFKRWNKSPSKRPPTKSWKPEEMKIIGWCLQRKISVSITPDWKEDMNRWIIEISVNGNIHADPNRYDDDTVLNKLCEYYKYYYDKHNKQ